MNIYAKIDMPTNALMYTTSTKFWIKFIWLTVALKVYRQKLIWTITAQFEINETKMQQGRLSLVNCLMSYIQLGNRFLFVCLSHSSKTTQPICIKLLQHSSDTDNWKQYFQYLCIFFLLTMSIRCRNTNKVGTVITPTDCSGLVICAMSRAIIYIRIFCFFFLCIFVFWYKNTQLTKRKILKCFNSSSVKLENKDELKHFKKIQVTIFLVRENTNKNFFYVHCL